MVVFLSASTPLFDHILERGDLELLWYIQSFNPVAA